MSTAWRRWFGGRVAASWALAADETRQIPGGRRAPVVVRVQQGLLLVTREGDPRDHVLAAGEEAVFPPGGRIAAWALEPAVASVGEAVAPAGGVRVDAVAAARP